MNPIHQTFNLLLSVTDKLLDKMPSYSQRKKEKYFKLKEEYRKEYTLGLDYNLIDNKKDELEAYIETFSQELEK